MVGHEGRPSGPVGVEVDRGEAGALEDRSPPLHGSKGEGLGHAVAQVQQPVPRHVEDPVEPRGGRVLDDHQASPRHPGRLPNQRLLLLPSLHVVKHEEHHDDVVGVVGRGDPDGVRHLEEREVGDPIVVRHQVGQGGTDPGPLGQPAGDQAGPRAEVQEGSARLEERGDLPADLVLPQEHRGHPTVRAGARREGRGTMPPMFPRPPREGGASPGEVLLVLLVLGVVALVVVVSLQRVG